MLSLPTVTLLSIDCIDPLRTIKAMQYSLLQAKFAEAVLVTSPGVWKPQMVQRIGGRGRIDQITVHFVEPGPRSDYERQNVSQLSRWFKTEFCLFQEWDSAILNPRAWSAGWLQNDFIGAPWPYEFSEPHYPKCTEENCVGNGGFSLRSRRFCTTAERIYHTLGRPTVGFSDAWLCRTIRPQLEADGITFAAEDEAAHFSCENRFYNGQFGIHGKNTIAMNGWKWDFDWLR